MRIVLDVSDDQIMIEGSSWMNAAQFRRYIKTLQRMTTVQQAQIRDRVAAVKAAQPKPEQK